MNPPEGLPPLAARKGRLYDTGAAKWYHGTPMDLAENRACICWLLGPCPSCGSITTNYGSAYSCVNRYCGNNAVNFATDPVDSTPDWWETELNVFLDGNAWCATKDGFTNLQESPAGFGASPKEAVANLLEAVRAEPEVTTTMDATFISIPSPAALAPCDHDECGLLGCKQPASEPQIESSPTPETDASERIIPSRLTPEEFDQQHGEWVPADFARRLERERDEWREVASKQAGMHDEACRERDALRGKLLADDSDSIVGACNCMTKSPDVQHHKRGCKYRLISERDALKAENGRLRAALEPFRKVAKSIPPNWPSDGLLVFHPAGLSHNPAGFAPYSPTIAEWRALAGKETP